MRKKLNIVRHIIIMTLVIIIFSIGLLLGQKIEGKRVDLLYNNVRKQELDFQKILTEKEFLNYVLYEIDKNNANDKTKLCKTLLGNFYTSIENLDKSRIKLEDYMNMATTKEEDFYMLKDYYANLQIDYWILTNKIKKVCPNSDLHIILYFYGNKKKCPNCEDEGVHLSYVKAKLKDKVMIFALDKEKEGPIKLLKQKYSINERELPTLIIDDKIYGYLTNEEIFKILCKNGLNDQICVKE